MSPTGFDAREPCLTYVHDEPTTRLRLDFVSLAGLGLRELQLDPSLMLFMGPLSYAPNLAHACVDTSLG